MKICVVGPGALGCFFSATLARAGHQVWLVDHRSERARRIEAHGITLYDRNGQATVVPVPTIADPAQAAPVELALLCVKSDSAAGAARSLAPALARDGLLIAMQNGIAHHRELSNLAVNWALGVTAQGAHLLGEGVVRHGGDGPTFLGSLSPVAVEVGSRLNKVAELLTRAGIDTEVVDDILAAAWNKLIINVGINALTVVEDCTNGELLSRPQALVTMKAAVHEAVLVASALGIAVFDNPEERVLVVCRDTRANVSSMLQDIRAGRHTEVDAINGEIVRLAERLGISASTNGALVAAVKDREFVQA
ncbi:MAG: 2-dehydropantoate 2-reductase [Proteobacteria bacterium]|nr:2-dehydropantoate 2-reductase [Desulfobulbaceae bacterium]MBU4151939.1 2-dehydropantoate 2-reductase [Pseudomonadota bacterium]